MVEDGLCLSGHASSDPRGATSALPGLVAAVLAEAPGFDAVAVTVGPGSFTGIRAALALAHGLGLGEGAPVVGVTSVEAFTGAVAAGHRPIWVAIDTKRGRLFLGRDGRIEVVDPDAVKLPDGPIIVAGDAADILVARLLMLGADAVRSGVQAIEAFHVGVAGARRLAGGLPPLLAQPLYVEPPAARTQPVLRAAPA